MPTALTPDELEAEFRMLVARAGVTVPEERMPSILAGYAAFRGDLELLRHANGNPETPTRDHTSEMGNIWRMPGAAQ
jgi:hypothetical protein